MRSFSYFLAAVVVTALALGAAPRLLSRPIDRLVRRWIEALPLCAVVVVSDRDGVVFQRLVGAMDVVRAEERAGSKIEVTSISSRYTVVAIAAVADRGWATSRQPLPYDRGHGRYALGFVAPRPAQHPSA
jgi:hypothetical protein